MYIFTSYIKLFLIISVLVVAYLFFRSITVRRHGDNKPKHWK
jgi:hypothetical protein